MAKKCYIRSLAQVSCQKPLSDEWLEFPAHYAESYVRAVEPDSKGLIVPSEARRMSKILKRTVCTAITALNDSGIEHPDAIITGTGMGCMENSEKFLIDLSRFGESCLKPTLFMQSTHNTISSLVAIILKCHGYNNTYTQGHLSFESALLDAWLQIKSGAIGNALIGAHDEVTPLMAAIFNRIRPQYRFISETSVSAMLAAAPNAGGSVEVADVQILSNTTVDDLAARLSADTDSVMLMGVNGTDLNDDAYRQLLGKLSFTPAVLKFKNIFGENFASSAMAFYVAATMLRTQTVPAEMIMNGGNALSKKIPEITIINHSGDSAWSIIRLKI